MYKCSALAIPYCLFLIGLWGFALLLCLIFTPIYCLPIHQVLVLEARAPLRVVLERGIAIRPTKE